MKLAIVAPSPVPYTVGGAEKLWWGMLQHFNQRPGIEVELIKLPSPERDFWQLMESYKRFSELDLGHFDMVISTKYPAWMIRHHNHHCYLQHKLRGLYDTYHFSGQPEDFSSDDERLQPLLNILNSHPENYDILPVFWDTLDQTRLLCEEEVFAFPGPLTRKIVHFLDDLALRPGHIKRYSAISHNVVGREGYFPANVHVDVSHHPSDLEGIREGCYDNIFTISRLDSAKRIKLLLEAFMQTRGDIQFRIAGTGPDAEELKLLAQSDPRIRFLGRITDAEVIEEYAAARCVPFIPYDEDYGLITIEAMQAAKPVITTEDAGGVNEFVISGVNGFSVPVNADSIAEAMQRFIDDPDLAQTMGIEAKKTVAHINWGTTLDMLLKTPEAVEVPESVATGERKKIVVALNFSVWPPQGGGQSRVYNLYKSISEVADVVIVSLGEVTSEQKKLQLSQGFYEHAVPLSAEQHAADNQMNQDLGVSVTDISAISNYKLSGNYLNALRTESDDADLVIASHPYLYYAIRDVYRGPIWYDAHNVELDMKAAVLKSAGQQSEIYLNQVRQVEQLCCEESEQVLVCSNEDGERLKQLYQLDIDKVLPVANGVSLNSTPFTALSARLSNKKRLGLEGHFTALFMGSWHGPNIESVEYIKSFAEQTPEIDYVIFGSVCSHQVCDQLPANVHKLGLLSESEKQIWMSSVDLALNPMTSGSGTNLKMLDYAAAGIPIITTAFGNRGLNFVAGKHVVVAEIGKFPEQIMKIKSDQQLGNLLVANAYDFTRTRFSWAKIAEPLKQQLCL
ncbi:MAG: glycosyltransferase family 4 protein [Neptuniibacter sp.]